MDTAHFSKPQATILIIDDVPDNINVLHRFLCQAGFRVLVAYDGEDGIATAEYALPDLILLDVMMPGRDGFSVCRYLKQQTITAEIPIIFMTALTDIEHKVKGFHSGAVDYITKPFQQEEVLARLTTQLSLRQTQQQLLQRNRELDAYAHTVSHDLKNPLSAIISLSDLLLESLSLNKTPSERQLRELNFIRQAGQQAVNIIDALLLLAGVSRQKTVQIIELDMLSIMHTVIEQRLDLFIKRYHGVIELPAYCPNALGYAPWVEEIWVNYISNALKYGGSPPKLRLGATPEENGQIRYWVRDNGTGLSKEEMAELFKPFNRLGQTKVDGHGLGLSIVRQIAERLGGQVGVNSQLGHGSEFYFILPGCHRY
jgi:two-component system, sensor histidine kinase and response regulator